MAIDPGAAGHRLGAGDGDDPLILDNRRYQAGYLAIPSEAAMQRAGEKSWTNATHLVIAESEHPLAGQHLTLAHLNGAESASPVVVNGAGNWCRPRRATAPSCG